MSETDEIEENSVVKIVESTLRSVAASIPIAASQAQGWSEYKNYIQEQNIKEIINNFLEKIRTLEDKIDKNFFESNELKHLVIKTCFLGKEELVEEKKKYLGWFLANSCLSENINDSTRNAVLETLIKLNPLDISIMSSMQYNGTDITGRPYSWLPGKLLVEKYGKDNLENTMTSLCYLRSLGVIHEMNEESDRESIDNVIKKHDLNSKLDKLKTDYNHEFGFGQEVVSTGYVDELSRDIDALRKTLIKGNYGDQTLILEKIKTIESEVDKKLDKSEPFHKGYALTVLGYKILSYLGIEIKKNRWM